MEILWDHKKAATNIRNHEGVTFEEAESVLFDPFALTREDNDAEGEQRFVTLGMGGKGRILVVVFTYREETIRLISAWKANEPQRRRYEAQF
ncbi:MAG: BrnT family toxin [Nitrospirota bacterium]